MNNEHFQWFQIATDINAGMSDVDRFNRLLSTIRNALNCDAAALLICSDKYFVPLATNGLSEDVLGRQFEIARHQRFEAIARAGDIVRFPSDSILPDPFDGLIPSHTDLLSVHSCIGLPLFQNDKLIGAITVDAFDPNLFDEVDDDELRLISVLAANSLYTALLADELEQSTSWRDDTINAVAKTKSKMDFIGQSSVMTKLKSEISAIAGSDLSVLITGETGTGKELVAHAIYEQSARYKAPFVYLNCAALPESVAESELFGHIKGAFTGAISNRKGKFELANNGTLFLDEIGELSLNLQAKLLRAIQNGDIQKVGDDNHLKVDVRVIAATNRNLVTEVAEKRFREDLYHRLNVYPISVPPLRDRGKDITLLAGFFAERCQHQLNAKRIRFTQHALAALQAHNWSGNVRELEHAVNRAALVAKTHTNSDYVTIGQEHLSAVIAKSSAQDNVSQPQQLPILNASLPLTEAVDQFKTQYVNKAYNQNNRNLSATARQLGVNVGNLHKLMKRLNLK